MQGSANAKNVAGAGSITCGRVGKERASMTPKRILDYELLQRIATSRDHTAFQELYERYSKPSYNLALHLTRNPGQAEEAVQNAMFNVWKYAGNCRNENARSWLLRIVANSCQRLKKNRRTRNVPLEINEADQVVFRESTAYEGAERVEMHEALQRCIEKLPSATREIVALYYGANFSQREIGEKLKVPQTTVSMKIREALENMRRVLTSTGFAAAIPNLESNALSDVILGSTPVPPGLTMKTLTLIKNDAGVGRSASGIVKIVLSVIAVLCIAFGTVVLTKKEASTPAQAQAPTPAPAPAPAPTPAQAQAPTPVTAAPAGILEDPAESWRAVPVETCLYFEKRKSLNKPEPHAYYPNGPNRHDFKRVAGDAWQVLRKTSGTEIRMTARHPGIDNVIIFSPLSLPREWRGTIDTPSESSGGRIEFFCRNLSATESNLLGGHRPPARSYPFRIKAWSAKEGIILILTFGSGRETQRAYCYLVSRSEPVALGIISNIRMTIRDFESRMLPATWSPESDPATKQLYKAALKQIRTFGRTMVNSKKEVR